jgi:hypothetical protein
MAELLFITPQEMTASTILSGNIDVDKMTPCIANVQLTVIEPLLGTLLYDKIVSDIEGTGLTDKYLTLYNDFIKPITKNESVAQYIEIASYMIDNGGIYKHTADGKEVVSLSEAKGIAGIYKSLAQTYIQRFQKWICKNNLTEYKTFQDEVNAKKDTNTMYGWKL